MSSASPIERDQAPVPAATDIGHTPQRRGSNLYFVATIVAQMCALVRYVALARLLGPEQLGLAATLVVTASFFDMISDTGSDRFLIQDRDGGADRIQNLVQLTYVGKGFLLGVALVVFAVPIAALYKAPQLAVGIAILGIAPLIRGFLHLDLRSVQRHLDFRPEATSIIVSEVISVIVTVIAAWFTRNFTAIIYGMLVRPLIQVSISHLLAKRPYALSWDKEAAPRLMRYSTPLMLSGLVTFIGLQGDRVAVGNQLGAKALGEYSAVLLLIYYPAGILLRYMHNIYLPMVAAGRDNFSERDRVSEKLAGQTVLLAILMAVGFAVVAPFAVPILYGARFTQPGLIVGLIGVLQTVRFLINWPSTVALSIGRSRTVLAATILRLMAFPCAFIGAWLIGGLTGVVIGFSVGEMSSVAVGVVLLNRALGHNIFAGFDRLAMFVLTGFAIAAWNIDLAGGSMVGAAVLVPATVALAGWIAWRERGTITEVVGDGRRLARPVLSRMGMA